MENSQNINLRKNNLNKEKNIKNKKKSRYNNNLYLFTQIIVMTIFVIVSLTLKVKDGEAFYRVKEDYSQFFTVDVKDYSNFSYYKYLENLAADIQEKYNEFTQTISYIYGKGANDTYPANISTKRYEPENKGILPLNGIVTSKFGIRKNPFDNKSKDFHTGLDIAAPKGSFIKAAFDGTVVQTGYTDIAGNYIKIDVNGDFQNFYGHTQFVFIREGEKVIKGQIIATVGDTGLVTGPHLHFETLYKGDRVDPEFTVE